MRYHENSYLTDSRRYRRNKNTKNLTYLFIGTALLFILYKLCNQVNNNFNKKINLRKNDIITNQTQVEILIDLDYKYYDLDYNKYCYYTSYLYFNCAYNSKKVKFIFPLVNESKVLINIFIDYKTVGDEDFILYQKIDKDIIIYLNESTNYTSDFMYPIVNINYNKTIEKIYITNSAYRNINYITLIITLLILIFN